MMLRLTPDAPLAVPRQQRRAHHMQNAHPLIPGPHLGKPLNHPRSHNAAPAHHHHPAISHKVFVNMVVIFIRIDHMLEISGALAVFPEVLEKLNAGVAHRQMHIARHNQLLDHFQALVALRIGHHIAAIIGLANGPRRAIAPDVSPTDAPRLAVHRLEDIHGARRIRFCQNWLAKNLPAYLESIPNLAPAQRVPDFAQRIRRPAPEIIRAGIAVRAQPLVAGNLRIVAQALVAPMWLGVQTKHDNLILAHALDQQAIHPGEAAQAAANRQIRRLRDRNRAALQLPDRDNRLPKKSGRERLIHHRRWDKWLKYTRLQAEQQRRLHLWWRRWLWRSRWRGHGWGGNRWRRAWGSGWCRTDPCCPSGWSSRWFCRQQEPCNINRICWPDNGALNALSVDKCAVPAALIVQHDLLAFQRQDSVMARGFSGGQLNRIIVMAANRHWRRSGNIIGLAGGPIGPANSNLARRLDNVHTHVYRHHDRRVFVLRLGKGLLPGLRLLLDGRAKLQQEAKRANLKRITLDQWPAGNAQVVNIGAVLAAQVTNDDLAIGVLQHGMLARYRVAVEFDSIVPGTPQRDGQRGKTPALFSCHRVLPGQASIQNVISTLHTSHLPLSPAHWRAPDHTRGKNLPGDSLPASRSGHI